MAECRHRVMHMSAACSPSYPASSPCIALETGQPPLDASVVLLC